MEISTKLQAKKRLFSIAAALLGICLCCTACSGTKQNLDRVVSQEQSSAASSISSASGTSVQNDSGGTGGAAVVSTSSAESKKASGNSSAKASHQAPNAGLVPLKVSGTRLTAANGSPVVLKGISTHGLSWFPEYVNADSMKQLHSQWGANCIRLAMYTAEYNGYCTGGTQNQAKLKALVDDGVKYAAQNQMYAIIDWHILSDGNPNTYLEQAKQFFSEMAAKYASYHHVLYEICNEPNGGTTWAQIKAYAQQIIPAIRQKDADAVIIVGTPNWCQCLGQAAADPLTGYDNILYALHFYAATHTDSLRREMVSAIHAGLPVIVSEFSICDASGNGNIDTTQAAKWLSLLDQYEVSRIAWNLSNKNETSAMILNSCQKKSGWTYQELSASGRWLLDNMFRKTAAALTGTSSVGVQNAVSSVQAASSQSASGGRLENAPYQLKVVNSWESDGKKYQQYELTVQNTQSKGFTGWSVTIPFDKPMTVTSGWNGEYSTDGNRLLVKSVDYNGAIAAHGQVTGIGFIVHD